MMKPQRMVIVVLRFPPYSNLFQVDWFLRSGPDAAQHTSRVLFLWNTSIWLLQKAWCHGRTFASIMASTLFVQSSATRMKPKIAAAKESHVATSLPFVTSFCSQKTQVENCSKKVVNVSQVPALQGTWRFPAASCSVSLIMYRRGNFHDSKPIPACSKNVCFKFFSLCFFVVAQIALVSDIWSSSCSSYWSFVWLIQPLSSSHPTCPPQLQPDADQITLYEVICQCSQPCNGWWCSTKIMLLGFG